MLKSFIPELDCPGCTQLRNQLETMISAHKLPHAMIVEGENPALNSALAHLIARARLCTCGTPLSGDCPVCRVLDRGGIHPDIVEVQGSGKTGAISVDTVRQLHSYGSLVPESADGIVYILENGDLMLKPAQNAFLKLFEEPPENIMFIITCSSASKLLETIRSRAYLVRAAWPESPAPDEDEIRSQAEAFAASLLSAREADSLMLAARYSRSGKDGANARRELTAMLDGLRAIFRQALIIGAGAQQVLTQQSPAADELARTLSPARIEQLINELPGLEQAIKNNAGMALVTSALCVRLRRAAGK